VNIRRLAPAIACVAILGLWGGVFLEWGTAGAADASRSRPGADSEVKQRIDDLKSSVVGKNQETRGDKVFGAQNRPEKSAWDYTPREVCLQMKDRYPDEYKEVDCSDDKYSSPNGWIWTPGFQR
jgi:hypothetical protein